MNAIVEQLALPSLRPEWERIELLAYSLGQERLGKTLSEALLERLKQLQAEVERLRRHPRSPWQALASAEWEPMAYDLAALVLGPEIEPRIGWLYQQLQAGAQHSYPSVALVRELLALDETETRDLLGWIEESSPLRRAHVVRPEGQGWNAALMAGPGMTARLMGWPEPQAAPPGATRVWQAARWEDLILPGEVMTQLHEFLYWIEQRDTVGRQWGGDVGGGPLALFCGPSGTGKTFAAAVIANQLGWPLYRVDLGRLVSKYIGETEKNLNRLFDAAHGQALVLQFDEADSLFGQRAEIKDARDRYANMEVSHLLARIEAHQGPVILTTNLRQNIDPAFMRRFQVVVEFPRPDAAGRAQLWAHLLPPRAPRLPDVDTAFLGAAVSLTGGSIRNAALHAAFVAAGTARPIGLPEIALAVWRELAKDGRELTPADLGALAPWLPEEVTWNT